MKIQLDYNAKVITLEDNVNLGDFFEKIKKILPDFKKWKLETKTIINWTNPISISYTPYHPDIYPYNPYERWWWAGRGSGTVTLGTTNIPAAPYSEAIGEITTGTYCLEVN